VAEELRRDDREEGQVSERRVGIGIVGLGAAGQGFIPALRRHAGFDWVAAAEPDAALREAMQREHRVACVATLTELLAHPGLEAVYVAAPTPLHAELVVQAAAAGKQVLVEKPMAVDLVAARRMVAAAEQAGVVLLVGHSHSHDGPIRRMRELIVSGELGAVRMVNTWCFTDWLERPRRPDELDAAQGGGVTFRQGAHQFDILRYLCGGMASSVRARTFGWHPRRGGAIGAHVAFLDFGNGAAATAVYNGHGGLSSMDLCFDISEWGFHQPADRRQRLHSTGLSREAELQAKASRAAGAIPDGAPFQPFFGLTVASCEGGDIRQSPGGLWVHDEGGRRDIAVATDRSPRDLVLDEFHAAITGRARAVHDGRWGLATLEVCIAAMQSSDSGREVRLAEQVPA
jgi:phthalate 4,5-cis-dihydrodiol dehydrogenase